MKLAIAATIATISAVALSQPTATGDWDPMPTRGPCGPQIEASCPANELCVPTWSACVEYLPHCELHCMRVTPLRIRPGDPPPPPGPPVDPIRYLRCRPDSTDGCPEETTCIIDTRTDSYPPDPSLTGICIPLENIERCNPNEEQPCDQWWFDCFEPADDLPEEPCTREPGNICNGICISGGLWPY
ncbi:hypothetical protein SODALDRAFT_329607 [Sodiomyces alkalinus F11]|uniref:Uncharacterized protein n=1 Tax=Sodiomyces alkalinus (strain CBS 110278 / VKM F-3762 / F11) TaxID=1314773 RepID=A0A3N2PJN3_SODAK|nr:hypothetical protein SODALDRAFT_329607 [Sodiomyces alkalinus F11]ROT34735.1 hypothetical protein SODALDRAFT_329607 [Sodiomyces alkalinus F11]